MAHLGACRSFDLEPPSMARPANGSGSPFPKTRRFNRETSGLSTREPPLRVDFMNNLRVLITLRIPALRDDFDCTHPLHPSLPDDSSVVRRDADGRIPRARSFVLGR